MKKQILVEPAEKNKRLISLVIDLVTLVASSFALYFLLLYGVIGPMFNYYNKNQRVNEIEEQYQINYNSGRVYTDYQEVLYKFYAVYYPEQIIGKLKEYYPSEVYSSPNHLYNVFILDLDIAPKVDDGSYKSTYFQYQLASDGTILINEPGIRRNDATGEQYDRALSKFMYNKYVELPEVLKAYNQEYRDLVTVRDNVKLSSRVVATGLSIIIFTIVIPLVIKHGRTLGNKVNDIVIVNYKDGFVIKKYKVFIRSLALYGLPLLGVGIGNHYAIISLTIFPIFISTLLMLFRGNEQDLADTLSSTAAVDKAMSLLFKSAGEASLYNKKPENQVVEDPEFLKKLENASSIKIDNKDNNKKA